MAAAAVWYRNQKMKRKYQRQCEKLIGSINNQRNEMKAMLM
jgi:hypothetical protein